MIGSFTIIWVQIILVWAVLIKVYKVCAKRDSRAPIDDLGVFFLLALTLYATLPPVFWLMQGGTYTLLSGRLYKIQPTPMEVVYLLNIALAYASGFSFVYFIMQYKIKGPASIKIPKINNSHVIAAVAIILLSTIIMTALYISGSVRVGDSYMDSYLVIQQLPLPLRQLIKLTTSFSTFATLVVIITLFQRWSKYKLFFWIYFATIIFSINTEGGRTAIAISLLSMIISWHVLVKPIKTRLAVIGGISGLVLFLIWGLVRNIGSLSSLGPDGFQGVGVGEFDELWANAAELLQAKKNGIINVNFTTQFSEFFAFIPSQLLWFEKGTLSIWFLDNFYPYLKDMGGGLAFGAISQAIIGGGILEALIRGSLLGFIAGLLMKWYRGESKKWWQFPLYLYILVWIYQSIRDTTFTLLGTLVQTMIPAIFVISVISYILKLKKVKYRSIGKIFNK